MGAIIKETYSSNRNLFDTKITAFEATLRQNLETFKDIMVEIKQFQTKLESCEKDLITQKQKCESKQCCSSEIYKKSLESKDNIIQLAMSTAIRINETKNLNMITELLKVLCGDVETLTPPKSSPENKENISKTCIRTPIKKKLHSESKENSPFKKKHGLSTTKSKSERKKQVLTPKKEPNMSIDEESFKDESVSEIEGTPGRISPIIQSKKLKSSSSISSLSGNSTDSRDKKKCPDNWATPEAKQIKLWFPSPKRMGKGKSVQSRLSFVQTKPTNVVDLTSSPEVSGSQNSKDVHENIDKPCVNNQSPHIQLLIRKESSDNDDTILPSPTSGPSVPLSKTILKDSQKFKKPPLSLVKIKTEEVDEASSPIIHFVEKKCKNVEKVETKERLEDSINILNPVRFPKPNNQIKTEDAQELKTSSVNENPLAVVIKTENPTKIEVPVEDMTHCEESSISILQQVNKLDQVSKSPIKGPLAENANAVKIPEVNEPISLLQQESTANNNNKRKIAELVEPVYKEPSVRKKAEKMALPGWCCEECKVFFGDLYGDDPAKVKAIIARCSKHRGRTNPIRPSTPPGFWYPRWDVPADTEEFNRRNNAD